MNTSNFTQTYSSQSLNDSGQTQSLVQEIQQELDLQDRDQTMATINAVMSTLGKRLTSDEAQDIKSQLPNNMEDSVDSNMNWKESIKDFFGKEQYSFDTVDEMLEKVGDKLSDKNIDLDPEMATKAVLGIVKQHLSQGEVEDIQSQLPEPIQDFWNSV